MADTSKWTREETLIAFYVYCNVPFSKSSKNHPVVKEFARLLGRSASALNMKVGNIGRLDPSLRLRGITGLEHGAKMEQRVWDEFHHNREAMVYEAEMLIERLRRERSAEEEAVMGVFPSGEEREVVTRQRVNQLFFRNVVLSAYDHHCCISGIGCDELLEACHIVGWADDASIRTHPENGLCMNPFFHRAYDKFLMTITPDYEIVLSDQMTEGISREPLCHYLGAIHHTHITLPDKFMPRREYLAMHYERYAGLHGRGRTMS